MIFGMLYRNGLIVRRSRDWRGLNATRASGMSLRSLYVVREQRPMAGLARKRGLELPRSPQHPRNNKSFSLDFVTLLLQA
jgi:hypothetical protein